MDDFALLEQKSVLTVVYDEILTMIKTALKVAILVVFLILPSPAILSAQENVSTTLTPEEQSRESDGTAPSTNAVSDFSRDNPIKIVYPVVMPPYTFQDEKGEPQGLAVDLLRLWSKKTGIPIQFTSAAWDEGLQMMREEQADVHASLYYTEQRDTYLDFATVVSSSAGSIFFHKNILGLNGPEDLRAYRVGAVRNSYHEQYVQEHLPEVSLVSYREFPEMLDAALKGDIRVFIEDVGATIYRLKERGLLDEFRYNPGRPLYRNNFWLAVREGDTKIDEALRQGMALINPEERAAIERKWLGQTTLRTQDTLAIAIYSDFAPYTFMNAEGQPVGLFVDIWRLWSEKTGRKIQFHSNSWNDSLNNLKTGGTDIHSGLFYSDARAQWIDYSQSFYETGSCFFYSSTQKTPYKQGVYAGGKIGVIKGSYHEEHLRVEHPDVDAISFVRMEQMMRAVLSGEISACLTEYSSATALINRLGLSGAFNAEEPMHFITKFYAGILKENTQLLTLVDEGFNSITSNELANIEQRWVPDPEKRYYKHPAQEVSLTEEERAWLKAHPEIRLGFVDSLEPQLIVNPDGTYSGIVPDLLVELNRRLGTVIKLEAYPVKELFEKAKINAIDGICNLHPEYAEKLEMLKTRGYFHNYPTIFARRDIAFNDVNDMFGKTVAIIDQLYFSEKIIKEYEDKVTIKKVKNALEGLQSLVSGEADLFIGLSYNSYLISKYQMYDLVVKHIYTDYSDRVVMATRSDWPMLAKILDKGLSSFSDTELNAIVNKWVQLPGQKQSLALTAEERAWLETHSDITLGYTDTFEPEVIVDPDGSLRGIQVDILDELNRRLGTSIRLSIDPVSDLIEKAQKKEIDGILSIHPDYADKLGLLKTRSYFTGYPAVFSLRNVPFNSPSDLAGKRVAIIDAVFFSEQIVEQYGDGVTLLKVKDALEGLQSVERGEADLFLGASLNAYLLTKYQLLDLRIQYVFYDDGINGVIGTRSDWPELSSILDKGLSNFSKKEIDTIVEKWIQLPSTKEVIELTAEEQAWLVKKHTVRVRVIDYPPFMIFGKGQPKGISVDYLKLISKRTGIKFEFVEETRPLADALEAVKNLEGPDLIQCRTHTAERESYVSFTRDYLASPRVIFTRTDGMFVSGIEDLKSKTVAVAKGTVAHAQLASQFPDIDLVPFDTDEQALKNLASGNVDAYIGNLTAGSYLILENGLSNLKVAAPTPLGDHVFSFGIRKDWPELNSIMDKAIDAITPEEVAALRAGYMSVKYEYGIKTIDVVKWILVVAGIGALALSAFAFWNRTLSRLVKERTSKLQEHQNRLKALASQLTIAEESERRRIAADLHDNVQQSLALARLQLAAARKSTSTDKLTATLDEISESMRQAVQNTRSLVYDLSSPSMNEIGISAAISEWLEEQIVKRHGLKTEFVDECGKVPLDDDVRAILFRSVRELLTNVVKHAQANKVTVSMKTIDTNLNIIIQDDGVGLDYAKESGKIGHFGLFSIRERMSDLGGSMEIVSEPGKGTKAILNAPLNIQ